MNERYLWSLWEKCTHPHPKHGGGNMVFPMEFAELIIQECMQCCDNVDNDDYDDITPDCATGMRDGALLCKIAIKEQFGIKE